MTLKEYSSNPLVHVLADSVKKIAAAISHVAVEGKTGTKNVFGEEQLALDVYADKVILEALCASGLVSLAASEELDEPVAMNVDAPYMVAYDPLDGSSLVDVNFSVGSIFGVYETRGLTSFIGRKGSEQVLSAIAVYGPRTTFIFTEGKTVSEFTLQNGEFILTRENLRVADEGKIFAPGNLRAAADDPNYKKLVDFWIAEKYTLRYSGGMVPDVNHILQKGKGIFTYPGSPSAPDGKLRLLYECAPLAFIMEAVGGTATDGKTRILDKPIQAISQRTPIFIGSKKEVEKAVKLLRH